MTGPSEILERLAGNQFNPSVDEAMSLPDSLGLYLVCLRPGSVPPWKNEEVYLSHFQQHAVIYVGIAEGKEGICGRYRDHFLRKNAGRSTLRKSLGVLFGYEQIPRDRDPWSPRTKFSEPDELRLSSWMAKWLILYFAERPSPLDLEVALITQFDPPLNLDKNVCVRNMPFRKRLRALRIRRDTPDPSRQQSLRPANS